MISDQVISVYVENLPARWTQMDAHMVFSKYGDVADVFLPERKPNLVVYLVSFGSTTKETWVESSLTSTRSEWTRHSSGQMLPGREKNTTTSGTKTNPTIHLPTRNKSYVDVASTKAKSTPGTPFPLVTNLTLPTPPTHGTLNWLARCAYGVLKTPMSGEKVHVTFCEHGLNDVIVSQVGGDTIMACFLEEEMMKKFCQANLDWVKQMFYDMNPWKLGDAATTRNCWVAVRGVPPHAWSPAFFQVVIIYVGRFLQLAPDTENRRRLDVAGVYLETKMTERINKELTATIGGEFFTFSLIELPYASLSSHPFKEIVSPSRLVQATTMPRPESSFFGPEFLKGKNIVNDGEADSAEVLTTPDPFGIMAVIEKVNVETKKAGPREVRVNATNQAESLDKSHNFMHASQDTQPIIIQSATILETDTHAVDPIPLANSFGPLVNYEDSEPGQEVHKIGSLNSGHRTISVAASSSFSRPLAVVPRQPPTSETASL
ncbi:hypothetical protein Tsubulata_041062 [Turnera subulata]|uniref:RRM domain-containing protein n=1 Tax=Turnera subulata TaxID=218843 RepID=A0A9Q0FEU4_9ROSI|nr:hypothetical protein Tsubulata_041062 [Turnera subulata]